MLFTDGVTEAGAPDGLEFGDDRLVAAVFATKALDAAATVDRVFADVAAFCGASHDDATALVLSLPAAARPVTWGPGANRTKSSIVASC